MQTPFFSSVACVRALPFCALTWQSPPRVLPQGTPGGRTSKKRGGGLFLCSSFVLLGWGEQIPHRPDVRGGKWIPSARPGGEKRIEARKGGGAAGRVPSTVPIGAFPKTPDAPPSLVLNPVKIVNVLYGFLRVVSDIRAATMYISEVMGSPPLPGGWDAPLTAEAFWLAAWEGGGEGDTAIKEGSLR